MKHTALALFAFAVALGACDDGEGSFSRTKTYWQMAYVQADGPEEHLRGAVFALVKGKNREEAKNILRSDRAVCSGNICTWQYIKRETAFDTWGVRPPGPRRAWRRTQTVTFLANRILSPTDILPSYSSEEIPW